MEIDEKKLGEMIGKAVMDAQLAVAPEITKVMTDMIGKFQTGVYVEVPPEELKELMLKRAVKLRAKSDEIAAEKPPRLMKRHDIHVRMGYGVGEAPTGVDVEAMLRERNEDLIKEHENRTKSRMLAISSEIDRLEFMAAHLPSTPGLVRLERRELDDLLFDERHGATHGLPGVGGY